MGVIHLGPLSALPGTCIVLCALAMLYDPGGTCTVLAYRPAHYCLRPKLEYRLPLVVLTRLNRFTLSHYGSRTPLSTLHAGLTASHARLSTGCLLGFAGSGLSPDYTIHAELAHNFRTLTPHRGLSIRRLYGFRLQRRHKKWRRRRRTSPAQRYYIPPEGGALNPSGRRQPVPDRTFGAQGQRPGGAINPHARKGVSTFGNTGRHRPDPDPNRAAGLSKGRRAAPFVSRETFLKNAARLYDALRFYQ